MTYSIEIPEQALTLPECHKRLVADMGANNAPSMPTLKRWSASGRLDSYKKSGEGQRPKFQYDGLLSASKQFHVKVSNRVRVGRPKTPSIASNADSTGTSKSIVRLDQTHVPPGTDEIASAVILGLQPLIEDFLTKAASSAQKQMNEAIHALEGVRRSLMLKYDSQNETLRSRNEELNAELRKLKSESMDLMRHNAVLSRIAEKLDRLDKST